MKLLNKDELIEDMLQAYKDYLSSLSTTSVRKIYNSDLYFTYHGERGVEGGRIDQWKLKEKGGK